MTPEEMQVNETVRHAKQEAALAAQNSASSDASSNEE